MRVSQLSLWIVALCLAIMCFAGCKSFFGDLLDSSTSAGPELGVLPPETLVGGQPSRWTFSWTKGKGAPYYLQVYITSGTGDGPSFTWEEPEVQSYSIEHDFVLPNDGTAPLTYYGNAWISDRIGDTRGFFSFTGGYNGTDYVDFEVVVLPAP